MILTVTPNPSIDLLFDADQLVWDDANRVPEPRRRPGGQCINVARALHVLGGQVLALTPLGDAVGRELRALLAREGVPVRAVMIEGETRTFVAVRERATGRNLLINPQGPTLTERETEALLIAVRDVLAKDKPSWVACGGSIPPGVPDSFYATVARLAHEAGVRVVADCDGEALRLAVEAGCDLLVPNTHEASRLLGMEVSDVGSATRAARALLERGASFACITLAEAGAVGASRDGCWHADPPDVAAGSAVGAGDAFLAALLLAFERNTPPAEALRAAVAAGTAALLSQGDALLDRQDYDVVREGVEVRRLD